MTIDQHLQLVTLARLRSFGGHRAKTASSLGVGIRTLTMWVRDWKSKGLIGQNEEFNMWNLIKANKDIGVKCSLSGVTILAGAIGVLNDGRYEFLGSSIKQVSVATDDSVTFPAQELIAHHQWDFDEATADDLIANSTKLLAANCEHPKGLRRRDLTTIKIRRYDWIDNLERPQSVTFENPVAVYCKRESSCHRVEGADQMITFVPAPGFFGCRISDVPKDGAEVGAS